MEKEDIFTDLKRKVRMPQFTSKLLFNRIRRSLYLGYIGSFRFSVLGMLCKHSTSHEDRFSCLDDF